MPIKPHKTLLEHFNGSKSAQPFPHQSRAKFILPKNLFTMLHIQYIRANVNDSFPNHIINSQTLHNVQVPYKIVKFLHRQTSVL